MSVCFFPPPYFSAQMMKKKKPPTSLQIIRANSTQSSPGNFFLHSLHHFPFFIS